MTDFKQRLISESSDPDTLASLLFEDVEEAEKAISTAQKAFETRSTQLKSLAGSLPSGKYKTAMEKLADGVVEGVKQTGDKADEIDPSSSKAPEQAAGVSESFAQMSKVVKQAIDVNEALMSYLAKQIVKSKLHQGADKDVPMLTILEEADLLKTARDEMLDAIGGVKTETSKPKGFLASVMSAVFGETEEVSKIASEFIKNKEDLIEAALELTPMEIGKFAQAIVNYGKNDDAAAKQIDSATQKATNAAGSDKIEGSGAAAGDIDLTKLDSFKLEYDGEQVFFYARPKNPDKIEKKFDEAMEKTAFAFTMQEEEAEGLDQLVAIIRTEDKDGNFKEEEVPFKNLKGPTVDRLKKGIDAATQADIDRGGYDGYSKYLFSKPKADEESKKISKEDILAKVKSMPELGNAGVLVIQRMIKSGLFDEYGIKVETAIRNKSLKFLNEEATFAKDDVVKVLSDVSAEDKDAFKDVDREEFLKAMNDFLSDYDIEFPDPGTEGLEGVFKDDESEASPEMQAVKDETGEYYLVPIENKDKLKDAGFDLEESTKIMKRMRKMAGIL